MVQPFESRECDRCGVIVRGQPKHLLDHQNRDCPGGGRWRGLVIGYASEAGVAVEAILVVAVMAGALILIVLTGGPG